jgi:hypothetical protein
VSFEWWSWQSYFLGVISAVLPSAFAMLWFAWQAPVSEAHIHRVAAAAKGGPEIAVEPRPPVAGSVD